MLFPLKFLPKQSYKEGGRRFGAHRANGRLHAACDLIAPVGESILAVEDGKVIDFGYFYHNTYFLVVDHEFFVVRYGEIKKQLPPDIKIGAKVKRGQLIAYVGQLSGGSHMLHFEMYSGDETGPLTVRKAVAPAKLSPYQRRGDLIDPTGYLDAASFDAGAGASALDKFITPSSMMRTPFSSQCAR